MSSYIGKHAGLYDLFYFEKDYKNEIAFIHNCIIQHGIKPTKKILELACGTGSHAFELEKWGYDIIATDYSEDMLNCAKKKANEKSSSVRFKKQDMKNLDLLEYPFDVVLCLFDSIGYVISNEALIQVFQGVHRYLNDGGLFIFEFWHAAAMISSYDPIRIRKWNIPDGELIRISETSLNVAGQVCNVKYTILELNESGRYSKIEETQINRYFLLQEMNLLLKQNNFEPVKFFSGFQNNEEIMEDTWHILAIARRK